MTGGLLDLRTIRVLGVREPVEPARLEGSWPCPGCGEQRSLPASIEVRIRNRTGNAMARWVRLCLECLRDVVQSYGGEVGVDGPATGGARPSQAGGPIKGQLSGDQVSTVTGLTRVLASFEEGSG